MLIIIFAGNPLGNYHYTTVVIEFNHFIKV